VLFECALMDFNGQTSLEISEWNHGDHRVRLGGENPAGLYGEQHRKTMLVDSRRLDDLIDAANLSRPVAAKIDAQGAEAHILAGGKSTLRSLDALIIEFCPYLIQRMGGNVSTVINFLEENFSVAFIANRSKTIFAENFIPVGAVCDELREINRTTKTNHYYDVVLLKLAPRG
jgi:hypothetical protein